MMNKKIIHLHFGLITPALMSILIQDIKIPVWGYWFHFPDVSNVKKKFPWTSNPSRKSMLEMLDIIAVLRCYSGQATFFIKLFNSKPKIPFYAAVGIRANNSWAYMILIFFYLKHNTFYAPSAFFEWRMIALPV